MYQSPSGMSDQQPFNFVERIIEASKSTGFDIRYSSVDGDKNYQNRFVKYYNLIKESIKANDYDTAFIIIDEILVFQIADFFHILKNARSRLLEANVTINPTQTFNSVDYNDLMNDLDINYLLRDTSTLAKLRDELPKKLVLF